MKKKKPNIKRSIDKPNNHKKRRGCQYWYDGRYHRKPKNNNEDNLN